MRLGLFLDRDGTINVEKEYLYRIEDFEFIPGSVEAIRLFNDAGYFVSVVSNQSGIGRGYYSEEDVELLHRHIASELKNKGARVDAWMYCPHHPDGRGSYSLPCKCRKPLPGMIREVALRYGIDLSSSIMIGDKVVDIEAGAAAGCRTVLVRTGYGADHESSVSFSCDVYDDLLAAAKKLLSGNPV